MFRKLSQIALLPGLLFIFIACKKKKDAPPKEEPFVRLDAIVQNGFHAYQVNGHIFQPSWLNNPEHGIIYAIDPQPVLENGSVIRLTGSGENLAVKHVVDTFPGNMQLYVRLYLKSADRVWYSQPQPLETTRFSVGADPTGFNKSGQGRLLSRPISPALSELPAGQLEIYLGTYKTTVDFTRSQTSGYVYFQAPENIPPGKYPVIGKIRNLTAEAPDSVEILRGKWKSLPYPPFPGRGRMAHFVWNNKGYIVGGTRSVTSPSPYLQEVWQLDLATRTWTRKKDFPMELHSASAFNVGGRIFLMGGIRKTGNAAFEVEFQKDIWEYDPELDKWTNRGPHPEGKTARVLMTGTVLGNRLYIGTGTTHIDRFINTYTSFNDWMEYNPAANTWRALAPVPSEGYETGFSGGACFNDGSSICIVGGDHPNGRVYADLKRYSPETDSWENRPLWTYEQRRTQAAVTYIRGVPFVYGGVQPGDRGYWGMRIELFRFSDPVTQPKEHMFSYGAGPDVIITPGGGPDAYTVIVPGAMPAMFPTPNGFIMYGGSYGYFGELNSNELREYSLD